MKKIYPNFIKNLSLYFYTLSIFFAIYYFVDDTTTILIASIVIVPVFLFMTVGLYQTLRSHVIIYDEKIIFNDKELGIVELNRNDVLEVRDLKIINADFYRNNKEDSFRTSYYYERSIIPELYFEIFFKNGDKKIVRYDLYSYNGVNILFSKLKSMGFTLEKMVVTKSNFEEY